jgi:drug/metabolite transporter (DMT)-like permease
VLGLLKNGALMAIIAHGLIGISLVWDKILLKRPGTQNLYSYVFWLGSLSVFGVCLVPFGYNSPSFTLMAVAFAAGVIHLAGNFFYYAALKRGEASETLAVMGGFSPVATAAIGYGLLAHQMKGEQLIGFALMTLGGFVMFFAEKLPLKALLPPVLLAAGLLGLVNVMEKVVYDHTNFVSGYVWFTIGTFAGALGLLLRPSWRRQISSESGQDDPRNRFWYFVNRFLSGVGSFLIFYAISLAHPAIVDSISGVRYAVIFISVYLLTKFHPEILQERFSGRELVTKSIATALVVAGLVLVGMKGGSAGNSGATARKYRSQPFQRESNLIFRESHYEHNAVSAWIWNWSGSRDASCSRVRRGSSSFRRGEDARPDRNTAAQGSRESEPSC